MSAITVNGERTLATNNFPAYPVRPDYLSIGNFNLIKEKYPSAVQHAAMLWLNVGVSKNTATQRVKTLSRHGYKFIYTAELSVSEANYTPFVLDMMDAGVEYVDFVGDYRTLVKLQDAMKQQKWFPQVRDWDSVAYSQGYLSLGGASVEGSLVFLNNALIEESANNPEMTLYKQWLARVSPGAKPDYFGLYAWSAGRLFAQVATSIGPDLTRKKMLAALAAVHSWDGYGLHAAHDTGRKMPTGCFLYVIVKNNKFVRWSPAGGGWDCNRGGLVPAVR
jgi:ABC-type branched-subunit amino acid transport system substrate-binding protein